MAQRFSQMTQGFTDEEPSKLDPMNVEGYRSMANSSTAIGADVRRNVYEDKKLEKLANKAYREAARGGNPSAYIQAYEFMSKVRSQGGSTGGGIRQSGRETMRPGQLELMRRSQITGNQEIVPGMPSVGADGTKYNDGRGFRTKGSTLESRSSQPVQASQNQSIAKNLLDAYDFGTLSKDELLEEGLKIGGTNSSILNRANAIDNKNKKNEILSNYQSGKLTKLDALEEGKKIGGSEKNILLALEEEDKKKRRDSYDFNF